MKKHKNKIFVFLGILVILFFLLIWIGIFNVDNIIYNNSVNISLREIMDYSGISENNNYFLLSEKTLEEKLLEHPYIEEVHCKKVFPNKLNIEIKYREEFAAVFYSGLYLTIDDKLNVLKAEEFVGDIFLIKGFHVRSFNIGEEISVDDGHALSHSIELIKLLNNSHIEATPILNYYDNSIELELNSEYKVKFGDGENIERKFNNFLDIYDDLCLKSVNSGIIDVGNEGLPSYRPFGE